MPKIKVKGQTVQTVERPQTNGRTHTRAHTHGRYQTYYLPCYAVDNYHVWDAMMERYQRYALNMINTAKLKDCFVDDMKYVMIYNKHL